MVMHISNPSTQEAEVGEARDQGWRGLYREFQVNLGYKETLCLKKQKSNNDDNNNNKKLQKMITLKVSKLSNMKYDPKDIDQSAKCKNKKSSEDTVMNKQSFYTWFWVIPEFHIRFPHEDSRLYIMPHWFLSP
jgi:hypothetical protein